VLALLATSCVRSISTRSRTAKDMPISPEHIINKKSGSFEPEKVRAPLRDPARRLINGKRATRPITPKERPRGNNIVDLMEALRRNIVGTGAATKAAAPNKPAKKPRKAAARKKF
jgi:DNA end-binding protein Ku